MLNADTLCLTQILDTSDYLPVIPIPAMTRAAGLKIPKIKEILKSREYYTHEKIRMETNWKRKLNKMTVAIKKQRKK